MALTVVSRSNTLTAVKAEYLLHARHTSTYTTDDLVKEMAKHNTTLTAADIAAAMNVLYEVTASLLKDGNKVETPLCTFGVSVHGKADTDMEAFTPGAGDKGHRFDVSVTIAESFRKEVVENVRWERTERLDNTYPVITSVEPVFGIKGSDTAKPGDKLRIGGRRMLFDTKDTQLGVFFQSAADSSIKVRADDYALCDASLVAVSVPASLTAGTYKVLITTKPEAVKELRTGTYKHDFVIEL